MNVFEAHKIAQDYFEEGIPENGFENYQKILAVDNVGNHGDHVVLVFNNVDSALGACRGEGHIIQGRGLPLTIR